MANIHKVGRQRRREFAQVIIVSGNEDVHPSQINGSILHTVYAQPLIGRLPCRIIIDTIPKTIVVVGTSEIWNFMRPLLRRTSIIFAKRNNLLDSHCVDQSTAQISTGCILGPKPRNPIAHLRHAANTGFAYG